MTKKHKFDNLLKGQLPDDRVIFRPILMHFAARLNHSSYGKFASDYKVLVESNIKAMEFFDTDLVSLISDPYRETSAFGAPIEFIDESVPRCLAQVVKNLDDVKNLKRPDVYKSERTLDRIKGAEYYQKLLHGNVPVSGWIEGPLAEACDLVGVSDMLVRLMVDPDFTRYLIDKCLLTAKDFALAQVDAGCDVMGIGDAICSQIDKEMYDLFVKEKHMELIEYIHSIGGTVKLHVCGDITHLLESFKDLNADILDIDSMVDLDVAREILGPDVVLSGNINSVDIQNKTRDEVYQISRDLIDKYKDSKYILAAGCEITVDTPHDNLMAMREASLF
jgi:MtaA/CmuA family methyltransferase